MKKRTGTKEWSDSTINIQDGCEHDCKYCFAKANAIRFGRMNTDDWATPRLKQVDQKFGKRRGRVMFPSTHDITNANIDECIATLTAILEAGNEVLIVSKPSPSPIRDLRIELSKFFDRITFRFTIGSMIPEVSQFWEPNAPIFSERLQALMETYYGDWKTSVSIEPILDECLRDVVNLVYTVAPYVTDSIWIGRMNHAVGRCKLNGHGDEQTKRRLGILSGVWSDNTIHNLHFALKDHPLVRWKDSIKKVIGLPEEEPG